MAVPRYQGRFGVPEAERLLWRAGFGPRRGEAARLARARARRRRALADPPGRREVVGPPPHDEKGRRLAPADAWGHDHLWWLDRMVRTSRPLVERMTLNLHDWFATSNSGVGSQKLMLAQNRLLRRYALGNFGHLLTSITANPAMLLWLSGVDNDKGVAERELRPRADGALHARRGERVHRARRPRAGTGADRLDERPGSAARATPTSASTPPPRRGHEGDLRQAGDVLMA